MTEQNMVDEQPRSSECLSDIDVLHVHVPIVQLEH
jgi:hypothetical protein